MGRDRSEFSDFVAARWPAMLRTAYLLTGDRGHAEDLVQTALSKCFVAWPRLRASQAADASTEDLAQRSVVMAALADLPPKQGAVVVLRFYEDLKVEQVARQMGCTSGSVKRQTSVALGKLRTVLGESADLFDGVDGRGRR